MSTVSGRIWRVTLVALTVLPLTQVALRADAAEPPSQILRLRDFPPGWRATPVPQPPKEKAAACRHLKKTQAKSVSSSLSPRFTNSQDSEWDDVAAGFTKYRSATTAKEQVRAFATFPFLQCLVDGTNHNLESGNPGSTASTTVRPMLIPDTDERVRAIEATTHVSGFERFEFRQQIIFVRRGKRIATLHVDTANSTDYSILRERLIRVLQHRLAGADGISA